MMCMLQTVVAWRTDMTWLKEAEKKHSRVALLALPTLFALKQSGVADPVTFLSSQPLSTQVDFFAASAILEAGVSLPRFTNFFELKSELEPGNIVRSSNSEIESQRALDRTETGLGRLAMMCTIVWLVSSLVQ